VKYTALFDPIAIPGTEIQPKPLFPTGSRVRLLCGRFRGRTGRVLEEIAGYYHIHVFGVGVNVTTLARSNEIEQA
jgi:hypothetical protein